MIKLSRYISKEIYRKFDIEPNPKLINRPWLNKKKGRA